MESPEKLPSFGKDWKLAGVKHPESSVFQYRPLPADPQIVRVLKVLPGKEPAPLICTLEFAAYLPQESEGNGKQTQEDSEEEYDSEAEEKRKKREWRIKESLRYPFSKDGVPAPEFGRLGLTDLNNKKARYDALSYTWGTTGNTRSITVNDCPFSVTPNLESALLHVRSPKKTRRLWVDAICIDQSNNEEKSKEVLRMRDIYFHARRVIVWLGEGNAASDKGMEFADTIYKAFSQHGFFGRGAAGEDFAQEVDSEEEDDETFFDWMELNMRQEIVKAKGLLTEQHIDDWMRLHDIFMKPWWSRAWILQEVVLARRVTVMCGHAQKPWSVISMAGQVALDTLNFIHPLITSKHPQYQWVGIRLGSVEQLVDRRQDTVQKEGRNIFTKGALMNFSERAGSASKSLVANIDRGCLLPHDKIFSILGLLPTEFKGAITPDYNKPVDMLYKEVVKAYIEKTGYLNIICSSQSSMFYPPGYSSWMPDWTREMRSSVLADRGRSELFEWGTQNKACASFSEDLSVLTVEGFAVSIVEAPYQEYKVLKKLVKSRNIWPGKDGAEISQERLCPCLHCGRLMKRVLRKGEGAPPEPCIWEFEEDFSRVMKAGLTSISHTGMGDRLDEFLQGFTLEYWETLKQGSSFEASSCAGRKESKTEKLGKDNGLTEMDKASTPQSVSQKAQSDAEEDRKDDGGDQRALLDNLYVLIRGHTKGRTIIKTEDARLGLGPEYTRPGDLLCLLLGCDAPVILRKREDGMYTFIGDIHVRGLTLSNFQKALDEGKYVLEKFSMV